MRRICAYTERAISRNGPDSSVFNVTTGSNSTIRDHSQTTEACPLHVNRKIGHRFGQPGPAVIAVILFFLLSATVSAEGLRFPFSIDIKGDSLFLSLDKHRCAAESGITLTAGLTAIAGNRLSLDLSTDIITVHGHVVLVGGAGLVLTGERLTLDGRRLLVLLENHDEAVICYDLATDQPCREIPPEFVPPATSTDNPVARVRETNIYVRTPLIRYYPDRQVRFWKGRLFFEGNEAGVLPYLAVKIGKLPPPAGFVIQEFGVRSDEGLAFGFGYQYLLSDAWYGTVSARGRHLLFQGEYQRDPLGELGFTVSGKSARLLLNSSTNWSSDDEFRQRFQVDTSPEQENPHYTLDVFFLKGRPGGFNQLLDTQQRVSWTGGRTVDIRTSHDLENEWSTAVGYRETLFNSLVGRCDFSYFHSALADSSLSNDRSRGAFSLDWYRDFLSSSFSYSREHFAIDDFTNEETSLSLRSPVLATSDRSIMLSFSEEIRVKRLYRDRIAESITNSVSATLRTASVALTRSTLLQLDSHLIHQWEQDLRQEAFIDAGGQIVQKLSPSWRTGIRYTFITRRDMGSPWLIGGYHNQLGTLFLTADLPQRLQAVLAFDYDISAEQALAGTSRIRASLLPFLQAEALLEYSFFAEDWTRADLILVRDLHFADLRLIWRILSDAVLVEYAARF